MLSRDNDSGFALRHSLLSPKIYLLNRLDTGTWFNRHDWDHLAYNQIPIVYMSGGLCMPND